MVRLLHWRRKVKDTKMGDIKYGWVSPSEAFQGLAYFKAQLDDGHHVRYLDIGGRFLDKEGNIPKAIMYDYLHLTPEGYQKWADAIREQLAAMLKEAKSGQ